MAAEAARESAGERCAQEAQGLVAFRDLEVGQEQRDQPRQLKIEGKGRKIDENRMDFDDFTSSFSPWHPPRSEGSP